MKYNCRIDYIDQRQNINLMVDCIDPTRAL